MSARKVMLLGEIGVGKSSLARRLADDTFSAEYTPTIGVDVYKYEVPAGITGHPLSLIIWDTDGNFGDAIFDHVYIKQAAAALIVGDVSRRVTLDAMISLAAGFQSAMPGRPLSFVVNKLDLLSPREEPELPAALARADIDLIMTSALSGANVKEAFHRTAATILRRGQ